MLHGAGLRRTAPEPRQPSRRSDPDDVRGMEIAAASRPALDIDQTRGRAEGPLHCQTTDARAISDLLHGEIAEALGAVFVADNLQHGKFACGEARRQRRRHRPGCGQSAPARDAILRRRSSGALREHPRRNAPTPLATMVHKMEEDLRSVGRHFAGQLALPDQARDAVELRAVPRPLGEPRELHRRAVIGRCRVVRIGVLERCESCLLLYLIAAVPGTSRSGGFASEIRRPIRFTIQPPGPQFSAVFPHCAGKRK